MKNFRRNKIFVWMISLSFIIYHLSFSVACSDFFDQESDNVVYSQKDHLVNWSDSVFSVMGILNKLQVIADRTILLGEVRGDLVRLTSDASADLRQMATFSMDDDNQYNQPRDYYAIINNCNYYLAHADTTLKSNRDERIFMKEYAAVKAIRAWTYLQLVLNYGSVPFVTDPILTKEESERDYPRYELAQVCQYFLDDLATLPTLYDNEYPWYGDDVRGNHSRLFFFPLNIVRGDLNLWLGSTMGKEAGRSYFQQAALCYYKYISGRNGLNSAYPVGQIFSMWFPGSTSWTNTLNVNIINLYSDETYNTANEIITMIPGDSIRAEGYYSELRNLFNTRSENDNKVSISPSNRIIELSEGQANCTLAANGIDVIYAPSGMPDHQSGDLRLSTFWLEGYTYDMTTGTRIESQTIRKYSTRNVHIYRRQMIYLRLAEALNMAGYPRMAYKILERGLSNKILKDAPRTAAGVVTYNEVCHYLDEADSTWIATNFDFDNNQYLALEAENLRAINGTVTISGNINTVGIHTHGSGWTPLNDYYRLDYADSLCWDMQPDSTFAFNTANYEAIKKRQQEQVDSLILNECALECAFEGTRYYDLMRFALRQQNPGQFITRIVDARNGQGTSAGIDLSNQRNWYLRWGNGKIGY